MAVKHQRDQRLRHGMLCVTPDADSIRTSCGCDMLSNYSVASIFDNIKRRTDATEVPVLRPLRVKKKTGTRYRWPPRRWYTPLPDHQQKQQRPPRCTTVSQRLRQRLPARGLLHQTRAHLHRRQKYHHKKSRDNQNTRTQHRHQEHYLFTAIGLILCNLYVNWNEYSIFFN